MTGQPIPKCCATCARPKCESVTSPADCGRWTNKYEDLTPEEKASLSEWARSFVDGVHKAGMGHVFTNWHRDALRRGGL